MIESLHRFVKRHTLLAIALGLTLLGACGQGEPATTPAPAAPTVILKPPTDTPQRATPIPPTRSAPSLTPLSTRIEASATPVPANFTPLPLVQDDQSFRPMNTFQVALGDLDADGDLDAVFANMAANNSQVWLNDGTGHFEDSGQRLTEQGHGVGVGDLDLDGDLDLFITCAHYGNPPAENKKRSKIYLNDGQGIFEDSGQDLGDLNLSGNSVELIDIDGDGDLDACVEYYQEPYKVYLNGGGLQGGVPGVFTDSGITFPDKTSLSWGDLDGDGDLDLFVKEWGKGYKTMLNDGTGGLADDWQIEEPNTTGGFHSVALGDLDGDGDLDVFVTNGNRSGGFPTHVLFNDGSGHFVDSGQILAETQSGWVMLGDLNGDGHLDAYVSNFWRSNLLWFNGGRGNFDQEIDFGENVMTRGGELGDLDGDGDLDLFVAHFNHGSNEIWFNK